MEKTLKDLAAKSGEIVYIRPAGQRDLPAELRQQTERLENLYAVHTKDGARLALVKGRMLAFSLARENDFVPVNVH